MMPRESHAADTGSPRSPSRRQSVALWVAVLALAAVATGAGWMVVRAVESGSTPLPTKHASLRRAIDRTQEPATFWMAVGVYGAAGIGAAAAAAWLVREGRRRRPPL